MGDHQQSYYALFAQAGIRWKKTQKQNPKADPEMVEKKQEITAWLEAHRESICSGQLIVFFQDECHLLWGAVCGYVWGKASERIEVPITNERLKQTYYGVVNLHTQQCSIQRFESGNSDATIALLKELRQQHPDRQIALIWDGASYHRSQAVKEYLASVNQGFDAEAWPLTRLNFAPNDPRQNPVEDVWLQAKRFI